MKTSIFANLVAATVAVVQLAAQPSFVAPPPDGTVVDDAALRRSQYLDRVNEVIDWRVGFANLDLANMDLRSVKAMLVRSQNLSLCSQRVIVLMPSHPGGPFGMLNAVQTAYLGRNKLSNAAQEAIRTPWRTTYQQRGDTENHFVLYYTSMYLMCQLYPNEAGSEWFNGKSSSENFAEAQDYLLHWMDVITSIGSGEFNSTTYIAEYAVPMLNLASWADDPELQQRARMILDWLFADLAVNTLDGMLRGPNSRTDDVAVVERWNTSNSSQFAWLNFNACSPRQNFGAFGYDYAYVAANYEVPEVIYRIAMDRSGAVRQRDSKRSEVRFRGPDAGVAPVYKTNYITDEYAVGSYQGGLGGRIQEHVWDVTWTVPDPRGVHNTMFSNHPFSSAQALQAFFAVYPDTFIELLSLGGKPSYDAPDKLLSSSPYERVFQHKDTVVALYDIPAGTRFPQINGFFSKDLINLTEDSSGWIFAQGGDTFLAYRPLQDYHWIPHQGYRRIASTTPGAVFERFDTGSQVLVSPHLKNGTIVQAAAASEFQDFTSFKNAIRALPLDYDLDPTPVVRLRTLRGEQVTFAYDEAPQVNGRTVDYSEWKLFDGPSLNAERNSRRLVLTHGNLRRVIDFNTLTLADTAADPFITPAGGDFPNQVVVKLGSPDPQSVVRYTVDGSEPHVASPLYNGPLTLTASATVKTRTYAAGIAPGDVISAYFEVWPVQTAHIEPVGGIQNVGLTVTGPWTAETDDDWIELVNESGTASELELVFDVNGSNHLGNRTGRIQIRSGEEAVQWITVEQSGVAGSAPLNLSARAQVGNGENILIAGLVLAGPEKTKLIVRGVGPGLQSFGLQDTLPDPAITIYRGSNPILSNGDWEEAPDDLTAYFVQVGAFPLENQSGDSALYMELEPGAYTVHLADSTDRQGVGLAEVYVVEPQVSGSGLVNLSARAEVGSGARVLIPGFVIGGSEPRRVLIRGVGPGLGPLGVTNFLADPEIEVYEGQDLLAQNLDWSDSDPSVLTQAFIEVGAQMLEAGSKDAAILMELDPGVYTAHIRSSDGKLGVALLEVYILP